MEHSPNNTINKWVWPKLFAETYTSKMAPANIKTGFKAAGIFPFNPTTIPKKVFPVQKSQCLWTQLPSNARDWSPARESKPSWTMHLSHSCIPHIWRWYPARPTSCQWLSLTQTLPRACQPRLCQPPSLKLPRSCQVQKHSDSLAAGTMTQILPSLSQPHSQTLTRSYQPPHKRHHPTTPTPITNASQVTHVAPLTNTAQVTLPPIINTAQGTPPHLINSAQVTLSHLKMLPKSRRPT